jgi:hypothetical protein
MFCILASPKKRRAEYDDEGRMMPYYQTYFDITLHIPKRGSRIANVKYY